jgi:hypothetical protein
MDNDTATSPAATEKVKPQTDSDWAEGFAKLRLRSTIPAHRKLTEEK